MELSSDHYFETNEVLSISEAHEHIVKFDLQRFWTNVSLTGRQQALA